MENSCGAQQRARTNAGAGQRAVALFLAGIPAAGTTPCLGKWGSNKIPFLCGCCAHLPGSSSGTAGILEAFPLGKSGFYSSLGAAAEASSLSALALYAARGNNQDF